MATYSKKASKAKPSIELNKPAKLVLITLSIIALVLTVTTVGVIAQDEFAVGGSTGASNLEGVCTITVADVVDLVDPQAYATYDVYFIVQGRAPIQATITQFDFHTRQIEDGAVGICDFLNWTGEIVDDPQGINPQSFNFGETNNLAVVTPSCIEDRMNSVAEGCVLEDGEKNIRCDVLFNEATFERKPYVMTKPGGKKVAIKTTFNVTEALDDALVIEAIIQAKTAPPRANCFANIVGPFGETPLPGP